MPLSASIRPGPHHRQRRFPRHQATTTTAITSDLPDSSVVGQAVTINFTVTVTAPGAGTPTGNVTITDSASAASCTGTVAAGTCNITFTTVGARNLTATYASTGSAANAVVGPYPITAVLNDPDGMAGNYTVTINNATLTVVTRGLVVIPADKIKVFGTDFSAFTGRKVPMPTCSVMNVCGSVAKISGVKCSPAVGAATEPAVSANTV